MPITLERSLEAERVNEARMKLGHAVTTLANRIGKRVPEEPSKITPSLLQQYLKDMKSKPIAPTNHVGNPPVTAPSAYTHSPTFSPSCLYRPPTLGTSERPSAVAGPVQSAAAVVHYNDPPGSLVDARQTTASVQSQDTVSQDVPKSPPPSFPTIQSLRTSIVSNTSARSGTPSAQSPALAPPRRERPCTDSNQLPTRVPFASTSAYRGGDIPPSEAGADAEPLPPYQGRTGEAMTTQWGSDPKPGVILNSPSRHALNDTSTGNGHIPLGPAAQFAHSSGGNSSQFERACIAAANNAESASRRPKSKKRVARSASVPVGLTGEVAAATAAPSTPSARDAARPHTVPLSRIRQAIVEQEEGHGRSQKAGPARIVASARRTRASAQRRKIREQTGENSEQ